MTFYWLLQRCLPAGLVSLWYTSERNDKRQHHSVWSWVWGKLTSVLQRALESLLWFHQGLAHCFHSTRFISQQALALHNLLNLNLSKFVTLYYTVLRQLIILPHIKGIRWELKCRQPCVSVLWPLLLRAIGPPVWRPVRAQLQKVRCLNEAALVCVRAVGWVLLQRLWLQNHCWHIGASPHPYRTFLLALRAAPLVFQSQKAMERMNNGRKEQLWVPPCHLCSLSKSQPVSLLEFFSVIQG